MSTIDSILNTVILLLFFMSFLKYANILNIKYFKYFMQTLVEIGLFNAPTGLLRRKNGTNKKTWY